jgi:hypothetical protein
MMDIEKAKTVRNRVLSLAVKLAIVGGWLFYRSTPYYPNLITIIHIGLWCLIPIFCLGFGGLIAASRHIEKLDDQPKTVSNAREMYRVMNSWGWRWWMKAIEAPFLLFIGVVLGDWSLLIVQTIVLVMSILVMCAGAELYRRLPDTLKGGDGNGNGIADDLEELKKSSLDPISKLRQQSEEKKQQVVATRENMLDNIVGGDL